MCVATSSMPASPIAQSREQQGPQRLKADLDDDTVKAPDQDDEQREQQLRDAQAPGLPATLWR